MRKYIDIPRKPRTLKEMRQYLKDHPRRYGWVGGGDDGVGLCQCVKLPRLRLTRAERDACYAALASEVVYRLSGVEYELNRLTDKHPGHTIIFAGRSNGYLVLRHKRSGAEWALDDDLDSSALVRHAFSIVWDFDQTVNRAIDSFVSWATYEAPNWELAPND